MENKTKKSLHLNNSVFGALLVIAMMGVGTAVHATLLNETDVIDPPANITNTSEGVTNDRQQAFNERQAITLPRQIQCGNMFVEEGEVVNSHMIFYNTPGSGNTTDANRVWTFDDEIICIMANSSGLQQANTDSLLGAPGTTYPGPFTGRGLESNDSVTFNGNELTVTMTSDSTGDMIRVLTKVTVPPDTTPPVVYCEEAGKNSDKGNSQNEGNLKTLIGADDVDGPVDLFVTDTVSGEVFGPFAAGTSIRLSEAKGATPSQKPGSGDVDYMIKTQGDTLISATDTAGNTGESSCSS